MTLKVRILQFSTTFMQVYVIPKNFLLGSSLTFKLKEGPVRCAKVCSKSWVILTYIAMWKEMSKNSQSLSSHRRIVWQNFDLFHIFQPITSQLWNFNNRAVKMVGNFIVLLYNCTKVRLKNLNGLALWTGILIKEGSF